MNLKEQGVNAEYVFRGENGSDVSRLVYGESVPLFSETIKANLEPGEYTLADLGSNKGEFLDNLVASLPDYSFNTVAVDVNAKDLESNPADSKVRSDLSELALADKSVDVTIARYALAWNNLEQQRQILEEIKRVTKRISIIQHQGADSFNPEELQAASRELFSGIVSELKREDFFFSTSEQLERYMVELKIDFQKVAENKIAGLSSILVEKYNLTPDQAETVRNLLAGSDYIVSSTWVLKF